MKKNNLFFVWLLATLFLLVSCSHSFKITSEMEDFREKILTLDSVEDVEYFFDGHPHSSWGSVAIVINVDCDSISINDNLVLDVFSSLFESNQVRADISKQDAVEYAITFRDCNTSENILGFTTTDKGSSDLDEWYTFDGNTLSFMNDEIIITYCNGESENYVIN